MLILLRGLAAVIDAAFVLTYALCVEGVPAVVAGW
jgi:hypothetical protein